MRALHRWQYRYLGATSISHDISQLELDSFFTFSTDEIRDIQSRNKAILRIGAALQLGFLKMAGRPLDIFRVMPPRLLRHIGAQLDIAAPAIASLKAIYRRRPRTLYAHQAWALQTAGFVRPTNKQFARLLRYLRDESQSASSVDTLVETAKVWFYRQRITIPADRRMRDVARRALAESDDGLYSLIVSAIPEGTRASWERQLLTVRTNTNQTYLEWLAESPRRGTRTALTERLARVDYLKSLKIDHCGLEDVPLLKIRRHAEEMARLRPAKFRELKDPVSTLRLVCFLKWTLMQTTDTALLMAGRQITRLWREAYDKALLLEAKEAVSARDTLLKIFAMVDDANLSDTKFREAVRALKQTQAKPDFPTRAAAARWLLTEPGLPIRPLLKDLQKLDLQWDSQTPETEPYAVLRELYTKGDTALPSETAVSCRKGWKFILEGEDRERAMRGLEAATMMNLKKALRSGAAWIDHSVAFRNRDDLLISRERWKKERQRRYVQLNLPLKPDEYLDRLCSVLEEKLKRVDGAVANGDITIEEGTIRLPRPKADPVSAETTRQRTALFKEIGTIQLPDLILEVDSQTGFSRALLDRPARSEHELLKVYGGMLAHGTSMDASTVALQIPQLTAAQILSGMQLFEDAGRVRAASDAVASFQRQLPVTATWGDGSLGSSDMMSLDVSRNIWNARLDPRRGVASVGTYTHVSDFWSIIYDLPVVLNDRQAGPAIEGAIRQEEIHIDQLAVDTHGYTDFGMGTAKLLGFDLCPRLKRLKERKLHVPRKLSIPNGIRDVVDTNVSLRVIRQQWDELVRIAASIETGTSAVIALARYGSAAVNDPVYRAGVYFGRLIRSIYLCDYFTSESFRRIINRILVHGEAVHQLQRAIHQGSFSKPRGQRDEELIAMSGSLTLLTNLCLAWTTSRIQSVLQTWPQNQQRDEGAAWLKAVSPAHFQNINMRGTFSFPVERYADRLLDRTGNAATA